MNVFLYNYRKFKDWRESTKKIYDELRKIYGEIENGPGGVPQLLSWDSINKELSIDNGNTVDLSDLSQNLSWDSVNNILSISGGNSIDLSSLSNSLQDLQSVLDRGAIASNLSSNLEITNNAYGIYLRSGNGVDSTESSFGNRRQNDNRWSGFWADGSGAYLYSQAFAEGFGSSLNHIRLSNNTGEGIQVISLVDGGLNYGSDYSAQGIANFGDRWIPDVGWVKDQVNSNNVAQVQLFKNTNPVIYSNAEPGQVDPNGLEGWYFKSPGGPATVFNPNKINWYMYNGNIGNKTVADIDYIYSIISYYSTSLLPYIQVYTKPLNDGSDGGSWYRSRITYENYSAIPNLNSLYMLYVNNDPTSVYPGVPRIQLSYEASSSQGPQDPSEEILTIAFGTSSSAGAGDLEFTLRNFGYSGGNSLDIILDAESNIPRQRVERTLSGDGNQTVFNIIHTNGNLRPFSAIVYNELGNIVTIERITSGNNAVQVEILPAIPINTQYEIKLLF